MPSLACSLSSMKVDLAPIGTGKTTRMLRAMREDSRLLGIVRSHATVMSLERDNPDLSGRFYTYQRLEDAVPLTGGRVWIDDADTFIEWHFWRHKVVGISLTDTEATTDEEVTKAVGRLTAVLSQDTPDPNPKGEASVS